LEVPFRELTDHDAIPAQFPTEVSGRWQAAAEVTKAGKGSTPAELSRKHPEVSGVLPERGEHMPYGSLGSVE
jgi:hypothetical protein